MNTLLVLLAVLAGGQSYEQNNGTELNGVESVPRDDHRVLSRRKRFIVFPDGSSFQLVFCTQNHGYLQIGDIVWFGNTAALAWELPTDPEVFHFFKERKKNFEGNRRSDNKHVVYFDEDGRVVAKVPYRRKFMVNPAFAKRSVDSQNIRTISKLEMHVMQKEVNYLSGLQEKSIEFHRSGRRSLFDKIEKVLQALGWNGRECLLRILCENHKEGKNQGTFVEEIMRATFTLPKGKEFESDHHKEYDVAHGATGDCATLYPDCEDQHGILFNADTAPI